MPAKKPGRPPKPDKEKRKGELIVYLPVGMLEDFRTEAERIGVSMSALAGDVIRDYLYGKGQQSASAQEIASEVVRLLREQDILGDNLVPASEGLSKTLQSKDSELVGCNASEAQKIVGAEFAPKTIDGDKFAPKTQIFAPRAEETIVQHSGDGSVKTGDNVAPRTTRRRKAVYRSENNGGDET